MSRANVTGAFSNYSLTKFGRFKDAPANKAMKAACRLESQSYMKRDSSRLRQYALCQKCGNTTVMVNFDQVPSARVGLWGRCVDDKDYTHHKYYPITQREYEQLRELPPTDRIVSFFSDKFDR
jgi:hypothetical protein